MPANDEYHVRVLIIGNDESGALVDGTVVVNVLGECSVFDALEAAINYVNGGGFRWGPHGSGPVTTDFGEVEEVVDGLHGNPSTTLDCR